MKKRAPFLFGILFVVRQVARMSDVDTATLFNPPLPQTLSSTQASHCITQHTATQNISTRISVIPHDSENLEVVVVGQSDIRPQSPQPPDILFDEQRELEMNKFSCVKCGRVVTSPDFYVLKACSHSFCIPCISSFASSQIQLLTSYSHTPSSRLPEIKCPLSGCPIRISKFDIKNGLSHFFPSDVRLSISVSVDRSLYDSLQENREPVTLTASIEQLLNQFDGI
jgi:hypothetical protein